MSIQMKAQGEITNIKSESFDHKIENLLRKPEKLGRDRYWHTFSGRVIINGLFLCYKYAL